MNPRVLKKTALYFIGNFSSKILMAIIIPIYAFYIKSEELGYFDYSQTLMSILVPIAFLSIWEAVLKFTIHSNSGKEDVFNVSVSVSVFSSIIIIACGILVGLFASVSYLPHIMLMFVLYGMVQVWQFIARGLEKTKVYILSGIVGTVCNFAAMLVFVVWLRMELYGLYISYLISQLAMLVLLELKLKAFKYFKIKKLKLPLLKKMIFFSAPLTLNAISAWMFSGFSRFIITNKLGAFENGLYAFSNKFAIVISMLGTVVTMAVIEEAIISRKENRDRAGEGKSASELYVILMSIALVALPAITLFYNFIKGSEYYASLVYVPGLLLYASFSTLASNIGAQFQALDKTKYQFITTVIGSVITVVISVCFIGRFGTAAVVISQIIGALVMVISRYIAVNKYMCYRLDLSKMLVATVVYLAVSAVCVVASAKTVCIVLALVVACALALNKQLIGEFVKKICNSNKK